MSRKTVRKTRWMLLLAVLVAALGVTASAQDQAGRTYTREDFINVEGGSLSEKIDRAVKQFKDSRQGDTVWLAYHFQAREGVRMGLWGGEHRGPGQRQIRLRCCRPTWRD